MGKLAHSPLAGSKGRGAGIKHRQRGRAIMSVGMRIVVAGACGYAFNCSGLRIRDFMQLKEYNLKPVAHERSSPSAHGLAAP
jgi:hypothetical protein